MRLFSYRFLSEKHSTGAFKNSRTGWSFLFSPRNKFSLPAYILKNEENKE